MRNPVVAAVAILCLPAAPAFAVDSGTYPATFSDTSRKETKAYVGLNWTLGAGATPALVLGVTNTRVKSNGDTTGARLAFSLNLLRGIAPGALKLSYLNGRENLQGELGAGYNFVKSAPLLGLGVNAPFVSAGIDGYLNPGIVPYVTLQSLGKFGKPKKVASCLPGDTLIPPATCDTGSHDD